jgi:hypothetical protein
MAQHDFVSISVVPVDARRGLDGGIEYAEVPERSADPTPEQVCQVCFVPLDPHSIDEECRGPKVPNDISSLMT